MNFEEQYKNWNSGILLKSNLDQDYCIELAKKLLSLENIILNYGPPNYKEAPSTSITTRHEYYNLIDILDTKLLNAEIYKLAKHLLKDDEFYVKMWANIFRNGERIDRHMHHASPVIIDENFKNSIFKTFCGNLFLFGDETSETIYHFENKTPIQNVIGDIHTFSCTVEHETLPYTGKLRIGIAFDVYTKNFFPDIGINTPANLRLISKNNV